MTLTERMARVETLIAGVKEQIYHLENNDLKHIRSDIADVKEDTGNLRVDIAKMGIKVGFVAAGAAVIVQVLAQIILGRV